MTNPSQTSFSGQIIRGLGYSPCNIILLSISPGVVQATSMLIAGFFLCSKWGQERRVFIIIYCCIPDRLRLLLDPLAELNQRFHSTSAPVCNHDHPYSCRISGHPILAAASNIAGYTRKATTGSIVFVAYAVANIVGPQSFLSRQAPRYLDCVTVSLTAFACTIVLFVALYFVYHLKDKRRDHDPAGMVTEESNSEEPIDAFSDKADNENKRVRHKL